MAMPSATFGMGTYRASLASGASTPRSRAMNAAAGEPRGPVTATTSPGLAPDLVMGWRPSMVPRAVPATIPGPVLVSPPTIPVPQNSQHWSMPLMMSYAAWASRSRGSASAARNPVGLAPMAARSLKLTAAEYHPNCSYDIPAGKCLSKVTMSVETTTPSPTIAASSPGPIMPSGLMKLLKSSINCRSPMSPILTMPIHNKNRPYK